MHDGSFPSRELFEISTIVREKPQDIFIENEPLN